MKEVRKRHKIKVLTQEEAIALKDKYVAEAQWQLEEAKANLKEAENSPLQTTTWIYESVQEGQEGFEQLSPVFDPTLYRGETEWIET